MSLPAHVKATITPSIMDGQLLYVASLEEMPGVLASVDKLEDALTELRSAVEEIQQRVGGGPVEIEEPPVVAYRWMIFSLGTEINTIRLNYPFDVHDRRDITQEQMALGAG
ncbi:MAG: hypothetical protein HY703_13960 [Gemmatimonadetes bacterium]|nr:hypothetical protein [Gemmatimonadota bacterium]